jgi:ABC-type polysaccharide/polyol phosphate transport system ATPase subunit
MSDDIAIKVENLTKVYKLYDTPMDRLRESLHPFRRKYHKEFYALNDVSFEIRKGETVGIIGKNGSGKSTLLKILTGVLTPSNGKVEVNGKVSALLELGAGFNPELTGIENVYFNGTLMGYTREEMDARLDDILSFADIGDFVHQPVKIYSSGMFIRLAFAVGISVDPEIFIVDEALSVGDLAFQNKCFRKIEALIDDSKVILFVSHSMSAIRLLCSRAIWINNGIINNDGYVDKVTDQFEMTVNNESKHVALSTKAIGQIADSSCIITHVAVLNNQGTETHTFITGDDIVVRMRMHNSCSDSKTISVGIAIHTSSGIEVCRINNVRDGHVLTIKPGQNEIDLIIGNVKLLSGKYLLSIYLAKDNILELYQKIENSISFNIKTPYAECGWKKYDGIVGLDHTWEYVEP